MLEAPAAGSGQGLRHGRLVGQALGYVIYLVEAPAAVVAEASGCRPIHEADSRPEIRYSSKLNIARDLARSAVSRAQWASAAAGLKPLLWWFGA